MMDGFSLERVLIDGALFTFALSVLVIGSLIYNPRLWMHDYPEEIRVLQVPLTPSEKRALHVVIALMLVIIIGGLILSVWGLKTANGGSLPFLTVFTHVFLVFNLFNLFDAVVIDVLLLMVCKPSFMLLPNVDSWMHVFHNPTMHITNYLKGVLGGAVIAVLTALVTLLM